MARQWKWTGTCTVCDEPTYGGEVRNGRRIPRRSVHGKHRRIEVCEPCHQFWHRHGTFDVETVHHQAIRDTVRREHEKGTSLAVLQEATGIPYSTLGDIVRSEGRNRVRRRLRIKT